MSLRGALGVIVTWGAVVACSSSSSTTTSPFAGTWSCTVSESLTFTTPAGAEPQSSTLTGPLIVVTRADGSIATTLETDAGASCAVGLTPSGDTATIESGQGCTAGGLATTYTGGTLTVSGSSLTGTLSYTFTGTVDSSGAATSVAGSGTSAYICAKE